jgi:tetratricopeptide (TPR) repeat protein
VNPRETPLDRAVPPGAEATRVITGVSGMPFVGRHRELAELQTALEAAKAGRGTLVMLAGEPGIGKSALADALSAQAREDGALVLWGRCWEGGGAPAYWPWTQIFRPLLADDDRRGMLAELGAGAAYLAQLVPDLRADEAEPEQRSLHGEQARFLLFDAAAQVLRAATKREPLVLVLDDLHAADVSSLLMLEFLARDLRHEGVLAVGTYRDVEVRERHELLEVMSRLARESRRIPVRGLAQTEVGRLIEAAAESAPSTEVVNAVYDATGGNPFFVDEVTRLIAAEGMPAHTRLPSPLPIPDEVREAIRRRVGALGDDVGEILTLAAVLGHDFTTRELEVLYELPGERIIEVLEEARRHRLVDGTAGRYRFAHGLVRETLYDDLAPRHAVELHRKIGEALERLHSDDPVPVLTKLAHHFVRAAPGGDVSKAVAYATRAGDQAGEQLAYDEAATLYETALQALDRLDHPPGDERCELLLRLGDARWRAGHAESAREVFGQAADTAERLGLPALLGRAALGFGGQVVAFETGLVDPVQIELFERALARLPEADDSLRTKVAARLAGALTFTREQDRKRELARGAVDMSRRLGDEATLARVLMATHPALWEPDNLDDRLAQTAEVIELSYRVGDLRLAAEGHDWRFTHLIEAGEREAADRELESLDGLAEKLGEPWHKWVVLGFRGVLSALEGRFDEGEAIGLRAFELGDRAGIKTAAEIFSGQILILRREQGRLDEIAELTAMAAEQHPTMPIWRCASAWVLAELDRHDDSLRELERLDRSGFSSIPRDMVWLTAMSMLAEVGASVGDGRQVDELARLLAPYGGRVATMGATGCFGATSHSLGMLATRAGRFDEAVSHFEDALELEESMRADPWIARTRHEYARMLLERDEPRDRERAGELLAQAAATAGELGMTSLVEAIDRIQDSAGTSPAVTEPAERRKAVLRREGEYWTISYASEAFRLRDSKGLHHLARLVQSPHVEHHARELASPEHASETQFATSQAGLEVRAQASDDAGALLDSQAKESYRRRLAQLQEELEEAERFADPERAAAAREELQFVTDELARAVGLGGRDRRAASTSERARVNVTRAIKSAIERISEHDPILGRHLTSAVRTGTYCSYEPDPAAQVDWSITRSGE